MSCQTFRQLKKEDVAIAGGKGASLGEMINNGIPVPDGFVILAATFEKFLRETDINVEIDSQMDKVNVDDVNSIDNASRIINGLILEAMIPDNINKEINEYFSKLHTDYVAVRSSATAEDSETASWAGELESFLFVNKKNFVEAVKKCWASLFTARAIHYRLGQGLKYKHVSVAVVVQKMVKSEVAGITFTVHPVTEDRNQMIIEAIFGLGEAIVGGMVTPDSYVIDKKGMTIIDKNIGRQKMKIIQSGSGTKQVRLTEKVGGKQKLTEKQIIDVAKICRQIEKQYKFPCDIEWAMDKGKFYIVQSRPITTLSK